MRKSWSLQVQSPLRHPWYSSTKSPTTERDFRKGQCNIVHLEQSGVQAQSHPRQSCPPSQVHCYRGKTGRERSSAMRAVPALAGQAFLLSITNKLKQPFLFLQAAAENPLCLTAFKYKQEDMYWFQFGPTSKIVDMREAKGIKTNSCQALRCFYFQGSLSQQ